MNKSLLNIVLLLYFCHSVVNAQKSIFSPFFKNSINDSTKTIIIRKKITLDSVDIMYKNYKQIHLYTHFSKPFFIKQLKNQNYFLKDIIITNSKDTLNCNILRNKKNNILYKTKDSKNVEKINNANIYYFQHNFYNTVLNKTPDLIITKDNDSIYGKIINNNKYYVKYLVDQNSNIQENTLGRYDILSVNKDFFPKKFKENIQFSNKLNIGFNVGSSFSNFRSTFNYKIANKTYTNYIHQRNGISYDFETTYLFNKLIGLGVKANNIFYSINYTTSNTLEQPYVNHLNMFIISPFVSLNKNIQKFNIAVNVGPGYLNFYNFHEQGDKSLKIINKNFAAFYKLIFDYKINPRWSISLNSQYMSPLLKNTQSTYKSYNITSDKFNVYNVTTGITYHLF